MTGVLVLSPFIGALAVLAIRGWRPKRCEPVAFGAVLVSLAASAQELRTILTTGAIRHSFGKWAPGLTIEWVLDPLSATLACCISVMMLILFHQARPSILAELGQKRSVFYAAALFLLGGLLGMLLTGDLFAMFVFMEIAALSGYALVGLGEDRAPSAALRYLLLGTVGAALYLLGIGFLYAETGTLNMAEVGRRAVSALGSPAVMAALGMILVGLSLKLGLFPLHGWLADAFAYAPSASSALLASVMMNVQIYALFRILFWVFGPIAVKHQIPALQILTVLGAVSIVAGSVMALCQTDSKRLFAYSSIAQLGLAALGLGIGNRWAVMGTLLCVLNHALMKGCLFLSAGILALRRQPRSVLEWDQLRMTSPWTVAAMTAAALSLIGIPPFGGFVAKGYIFLGAVRGGESLPALLVLASTLLTAGYFFRIAQVVFFSKANDVVALRPEKSETWLQILPLGVLVAGSVLLGVYGMPLAEKVLAPLLEETL